jgi:hypothetical protein
VGRDAGIEINIMKRFIFSPLIVFTFLGLLAGVLLALNELYDFIPSWHKLPPTPAKATTIIKIEPGNIIVEMDNGKRYRCTPSVNECWTENLYLAGTQRDDLTLEYNIPRTFEECDFREPYFLTWHLSPNRIIDCKYSYESFVDVGLKTVAIIDEHGNVWEHSRQWSAIIMGSAFQIYPLFCGSSVFLIGLIIVGLKKILRSLKKQGGLYDKIATRSARG